jgi:endonuclease/exonuclease/phosphatase family metal-dependent hydrolase
VREKRSGFSRGTTLCCAILFFGFASRLAASDDDVTKLSIKIATYNIAGANPAFYGDPRTQIEAIADFVAVNQIDVIGLQEVDNGARRHKGLDVLKFLKKALWARGWGMLGVYTARFKVNGGTMGNAILSRYQLSKATAHRFRKTGLAQSAIVDFRGFQVRVVNFHPLPGWTACPNHDQLAKLLTEDLEQPTVLVGDFNATLAGGCLATTLSYYRDACTEAGGGNCMDTVDGTYHDAPELAVDFVMVKDAAYWQVITADSPRDVGASDHYPVIATIELSP